MATKKTRRRRTRPQTRAARRVSAGLREQLGDIVRNLRLAAASVMVSVEALRRQNAEMDEEIALVLRRNGSDRIDAELRKLESLMKDPRLR